MLLIASILGVVGATLFRRGSGTPLRLQKLKDRVLRGAFTKRLIHTENRR